MLKLNINIVIKYFNYNYYNKFNLIENTVNLGKLKKYE